VCVLRQQEEMFHARLSLLAAYMLQPTQTCTFTPQLYKRGVLSACSVPQSKPALPLLYL